MSSPVLVPSLIETTRHIEAQQAFEFWRCTALAGFGDIGRRHPREHFSAKRLTVASADWSLTHTVSSPVELEFRSRHVDRNARAMVVIGHGLDGIGYHEQNGRGAQLNPGDISFLSRNRPFVAGTQSAYDEIRLAVPREMFEAWVGDSDAFAGRSLSPHAAGVEFRARLRGLAGAIAWMTEGEAQAAIEGVLHLLGRLVDGAAQRTNPEAVSQAAVVSLARAHIARRMHDPDLNPRDIQTALGLSRTGLYRAFAETGGIAAAIRDARLDLARRRLETCPDTVRIATIAYACGFTDVPTFNRGFRKRFGLAPGDLRPALP